MRLTIILVVWCVVLVVVGGSTVPGVRLIDHEKYMVQLIGETMRKVEQREWCNLRVNDVALDVDEKVLETDVTGRVEYTNGFVVSIQWVDIIDHTVQQSWVFDRNTNRTRVEVRGALRLNSVTLGFDVIATLAQGPERYTAEFTYPLLQFQFTVIKDMFTDDIDVRVVGTVPATNNIPRLLPNTRNSQVLTLLYHWNSATIGIQSWGSEVFQPIAYRLALSEIQFPRICYNCPTS